MRNVVPTEATGACEQSLAEINSRQDALTTRIGQTETRLSVIAQDQNNAADVLRIHAQTTQDARVEHVSR